MRIAVVSDAFAPACDPVAEGTRHLVDALIESGHEVLVVAPGPGQASYRGARVVRARRLVPASAMGAALAGFGPDVVHVVSPRPAPSMSLGTLALKAASRLGTPAVVVSTAALDSATAQWWQGRVHPRAARTLVTCTDAGRRLSAVGVGAHVWTPGVDAADFHPGLSQQALHDRWAGAKEGRQGRLVVGHVGSIEKEKVLRRLRKVARTDGLRLVVLADAGLDDRVAERLRTAGAKVLVGLRGLELAHAVASLDVLVQPRKREASVPGVRRALASGVPVVAYAAGGTPDVVRDGHNGLLAPRSDDDGLVRCLTRLAGDRALLEELAANARGSVAGRTWQVAVAELVEHHYAAVVGSRHRSTAV